MEKVPMTDEGHRRLSEELRQLRLVERPAIIKAIAEAREHGDLSENAEYHAARERQGFIEGRMASLEDKLRRAEIIDVSKLSGQTVTFGATVSIADMDTDEETTWQLVGADEADPSSGRLSIASPIARAMLGKTVGDTAEVVTPSGTKSLEILTISFK